MADRPNFVFGEGFGPRGVPSGKMTTSGEHIKNHPQGMMNQSKGPSGEPKLPGLNKSFTGSPQQKELHRKIGPGPGDPQNVHTNKQHPGWKAGTSFHRNDSDRKVPTAQPVKPKK